MCRLHKAIYGLKQAHNRWHCKFTTDILNLDFVELKHAKCVYARVLNGSVVYILLYVDDMIVAAKTLVQIEMVIEMLSDLYSVRDLGELSWFLGVSFTWYLNKSGNASVSLSQRHAIENLLEENDIKSSRIVRTPMITNFYSVLRQEENQTSIDQSKFRSIIGSLFHIALRTRPDILASVTILARYTSNPTRNCWISLERVLNYLRFTINSPLILSPNPSDEKGELTAMVDSDWGGDYKDRKSMSGGILFYSGSFVTAFARKQTVTALSTAEAEYIALCEVAKLILWKRNLGLEIKSISSGSISVYSDNTTALSWTEPEYNSGSRHVDIQFHFSKELTKKKIIAPKYVQTVRNVSDMFTKPLHVNLHIAHSARIGVNLQEEY